MQFFIRPQIRKTTPLKVGIQGDGGHCINCLNVYAASSKIAQKCAQTPKRLLNCLPGVHVADQAEPPVVLHDRHRLRHVGHESLLQRLEVVVGPTAIITRHLKYIGS